MAMIAITNSNSMRAKADDLAKGSEANEPETGESASPSVSTAQFAQYCGIADGAGSI